MQLANLRFVVPQVAENLVRVVADGWDGSHARRHPFEIEWRNDRRQRSGRRVDVVPAAAGGKLRVRNEFRDLVDRTWRLREWVLDVGILERITKALPAELKIRPIPLPDPTPDLRFVEPLLGGIGGPAGPIIRPDAIGRPDVNVRINRPAVAASAETGFASEQFDFARLESMRETLARRIPRIAELEPLRLWPWWPWTPWFDCAPDLIFRATQDCGERGTVILDESVFQVRRDATSPLNVTLTANSQACCVPPPTPGADCLVLDQVCSSLTSSIGGNLGAAASPAGYAYPGTQDRPFAGTINVYGTNETLTNADYYAVERAPNGTSAWSEVPLSQLAVMARSYLDLSAFPFTWHYPTFAPTTLDGHTVYESRHHYETSNPGPAWGSGSGRLWVGFSAEQVLAWVTSTTVLADGVYKLRVQGYNLVAGSLVPVTIPSCGGADPSLNPPSEVIVAVDNRLDPNPLHATYPPHPCGAGTVHACVTEPDTDFLKITIVHVTPNGPVSTDVEACGSTRWPTPTRSRSASTPTIPTTISTRTRSRRITARTTTSRSSRVSSRSAMGRQGAIPAAAGLGVPVPNAYVPVASAQWDGGVMKVSVPGSAFPKTCCYLLDLRAYKRTIVSCSYDHAHYNVSQRSFMVTKV